MERLVVNCIDIWTRNHENRIRLDACMHIADNTTYWWLHEEEWTRTGEYGELDFTGTFTECVEYLKEHFDLEVA